MAIPVYLQQFKAAGIYRVVFDKSVVDNTDSEVLRLVVGYSEKGPFNIPVYVKDSDTFQTLFGGISKKLEKRGIYFHRMALQMLSMHPIICLNLKKFDGETVQGATINTTFNPNFDPIETVNLKVEDIYDTTRFWELNAEKLNDLQSDDAGVMDQYINLSVTDTKANSVTYFIRKASGSKVSQYNITVNDWYGDNTDDIPEYLEGKENSLMSDFFAEIYVFKGKFKSKQVLASDTLKNYFDVTDELDDDGSGNYKLKLKQKVYDGFGDPADTLDTMYNDLTSHPIGHWVGSLIPYFKDKKGNYQALDIVFNQDEDTHKMMMSFNVDMLDEETANIDISGRAKIPTETAIASQGKKLSTNGFDLNQIFQGNAKTSLLGNVNAPVVADVMTFSANVVDWATGSPLAIQKLRAGKTQITGAMYVSKVDTENYQIVLTQIGTAQNNADSQTVDLNDSSSSSDAAASDSEHRTVTVMCNDIDQLKRFAAKLGISCTYVDDTVNAYGEQTVADLNLTAGVGTYYPVPEDAVAEDYAFEDPDDPLAGPQKIITSIMRIDKAQKTLYTDQDVDLKASFMTVAVQSTTEVKGLNEEASDSVYGSSVTFITKSPAQWVWGTKEIDGADQKVLYCESIYDKSLFSVLHKGDCVLADDGTNDLNNDGYINNESEPYDYDDDEHLSDKDWYYDTVYVQDMGTVYDADGNFSFYWISFSGEPIVWSYDSEKDDNENIDETKDYDDILASSEYSYHNGTVASYIVRVDAPLNQEIGDMYPQYLEGYTFKNARPNGTDMQSKVDWQELILSALTDYKGLRAGLLNKAEIDYRYVVDTFESYPTEELKKVFAYLCKEKQSAFCISNFPSVKTFVKCPYTSFTDGNGIFDVNYVVNGYNKKKAASIKFSLPTDADGASFIAFYTPLKFSDGYVDTIVPAAGLVSNLFMQKYLSRQPYYIVAGPNYGNITAAGLTGPDYNYSSDELQIIEPFGVNCMIYRPSFGTFINANQTAKQTPVSALSKVNVRELVIYLQDEIEKVLQSYQWEFNNSTTRNAILDRANQICALVAANGGIQAYQNQMDENNNTNEIIDNEMAVLSTAIEPGMGCGKMVQELTLYRTGQMSSSITE